jgi:hypothetical protein
MTMPLKGLPLVFDWLTLTAIRLATRWYWETAKPKHRVTQAVEIQGVM